MRYLAGLFEVAVILAVFGCTHPNTKPSDPLVGDSYGPAQPDPKYAGRLEHAIFVADRKYWHEEGGNRSVRLGASFSDAKTLGEYFNLNQDIMDFGGYHWVLSDIIVTMDFNGNGDICSCILSGPKPVVDAFVARATAAAEKSGENGPIGDFDIHPVDCLPSGAWGD